MLRKRTGETRFIHDKDEKGDYNEAPQKNIDTGMGVERTVAILNSLEDNYEAEMWKPIIEKMILNNPMLPMMRLSLHCRYHQ